MTKCKICESLPSDYLTTRYKADFIVDYKADDGEAWGSIGTPLCVKHTKSLFQALYNGNISKLYVNAIKLETAPRDA